jgi:hypothetical protein
MRKLLLSVLLGVAMSALGQQTDLLVNDFQINGSMTLYCESESISDYSDADKGAKWHLEQKSEKGIRNVTFWIDLPDPRLKQLSKTTWSSSAVFLTTMNGLKMYIVRDNEFKHLVIAEYEKGKFLVQFCSIYDPIR